MHYTNTHLNILHYRRGLIYKTSFCYFYVMNLAMHKINVKLRSKIICFCFLSLKAHLFLQNHSVAENEPDLSSQDKILEVSKWLIFSPLYEFATIFKCNYFWSLRSAFGEMLPVKSNEFVQEQKHILYIKWKKFVTWKLSSFRCLMDQLVASKLIGDIYQFVKIAFLFKNALHVCDLSVFSKTKKLVSSRGIMNANCHHLALMLDCAGPKLIGVPFQEFKCEIAAPISQRYDLALLQYFISYFFSTHEVSMGITRKSTTDIFNELSIIAHLYSVAQVFSKIKLEFPLKGATLLQNGFAKEIFHLIGEKLALKHKKWQQS
ncbi:hypothetical protein EGR_00109 [Echinococcus granulosus]|uniref:Uncharacterized protein n=1 Tax=Echinococcus granulosus TaxID=6210 RepID=W6UT74_ECHGR|nr:hypothetical protein EGR_00109 [Echinococcus granulosus]EUB64840.1 hypothetical protein EGR_00109 [Echinococcus granulosus]